MLRSIPRVYVVMTILSVITAGVGSWFYLYVFDTYHYSEVSPGVLYRDGVRNMRQFHLALTKSRAQMIVTLVDEEEAKKSPFTDEWDYIARSKVRALPIPIKLGGYPTTKDVNTFLDVVASSREKKRPVLVHCAQGIRRTGMMVAAYQMSVMGWDKQRAKDNIKAYGHSDRTINDIKKFIDVYDPVKREVTADLGRGTE